MTNILQNNTDKKEIIRTASNAIWLFLQAITTLAISWWLFPTLSTHLNSDQITTIGSYFSIFVFYQVLANFGQNITGMSDLKNQGGDFLSNYIVMRILNTLFFSILMIGVAWVRPFSIGEYGIFVAIIFTQIYVVVWYAQYMGNQGTLTKINIFGVICAIVIEYIMRDNILAISSVNMYVAYIILMIPTVFIAVYMTWSLRHVIFQQIIISNIDFSSVLKIYGHNFRVFLSQILSTAYTYSGVLILSITTNVDILGQYVLLERMFFSLSAGLGLFVTAAQPTLVDIANKDRIISVKILVFISLFLLGCSLVISFGLWFGKEFFFARFLDLQSDTFTGLSIALSVWLIVSVFGPVMTIMYVILDMRERMLALTTKIFLVTFSSLFLMGSYSVTDWVIAMIFGQVFVVIEFFTLSYKAVLGEKRSFK